MAGSIVLPIISKFDDSGIKKAKGGMKGVSKEAGGLVGKMGGWGAALAAVAGAAAAVGAELTVAVKSAAKDMKSQKLLANQMRNSVHATEAQIAANEKYLSTLSMQVGIQDDELRPSFSNMLRMTGDISKAQKLFKLALDASASSGKPLNSVVTALGKAQNGNTSALKRLFPELSKNKDMISALKKETKGMAEANADPFSRLSVAVSELQEQLGYKLLPYVIQVVDWITTKLVPVVSSFIDDMSNPDTDVGKVVVAIKEAFVGKDGKTGIWGAITKVYKSFGELLGMFGGGGLDGMNAFLLVIRLMSLQIQGIYLIISGLITRLVSLWKIQMLLARGDLVGASKETFNMISAGVEDYKAGFDLLKQGEAAFKDLGMSMAKNNYEQRNGTGSGHDAGAHKTSDVPQLADGGIVMPTMGGSLVNVAEAGKPEAVIPLDRLGSMTGKGMNITINVTSLDPAAAGKSVVNALKAYERTNGTGWRK